MAIKRGSAPAWDRLRKLAQLLKDRQPIPREMADFVADAILAVESKDTDDVAKAKKLTDELGLTALNRRRLNLTAADAQLERDFGVPGDDYPSQTAAARHIAKQFGISERTAHSRLQEAEEKTARDLAELRRAHQKN